MATKPIIADGGIRHNGDIAKSIRFGATMVMIGSLFAGHEESPGQTVEVDGKLYKEYYGSASDFNKGEYRHVEGKRILEPIKGRLADTLREMQEDLQSSISLRGRRAARRTSARSTTSSWAARTRASTCSCDAARAPARCDSLRGVLRRDPERRSAGAG